MIESVKHVGAELYSSVFSEPGILDNSEIHSPNSVRPQSIASGTAKTLSWLNAIEIDNKSSNPSSRTRDPRCCSGEKEIVQRSARKESGYACTRRQRAKIRFRRRQGLMKQLLI